MEYNGWTKEKLRDFEADIAKNYEEGKIKSPIHLSDGSEEELIKIFKNFEITPKDWIFSTWRSHYHWLLSGRDPKELKTQILEGHSMHIFGDKFFTSAIVGGIAPIALGVAKANLMQQKDERVFCFLGCMASTGGLAQECFRYAKCSNLPILYIIENNDMSVRASTSVVWGKRNSSNKVIEYQYKRLRPHAGSGQYVMF